MLEETARDLVTLRVLTTMSSSSGTTGNRALIALNHIWQPIFHAHASKQVVLYNAQSHALSIRPHLTPNRPRSKPSFCHYCNQPIPDEPSGSGHMDGEFDYTGKQYPHESDRHPNYFQLLSNVNEMSRPATPSRDAGASLSSDSMAHGYYEAFFEEGFQFFNITLCDANFLIIERKLGQGAFGSVFLCRVRIQNINCTQNALICVFQHVLNGNNLGRFAVKKIAVGESPSYLLAILREVFAAQHL